MPSPARQTDSRQAPDLDELSDAELIQVYLEERPPESERAFAELYERWTPKLQRFLQRRYGVSLHEAEDLVAQTWKRVHEHAHRFDQSKRFSTWIFAICGNFGKNALRSEDRSPMTAMTTLEARWGLDSREDRPLQFESEEDWSDPEASTRNREIVQEIRSVVESLPPIHSAVLRLYHLEGLSYQEIGQQLGIARGTVKSRIHRARDRFRDEWQRREEEGGDEVDGPRVRITEDGQLEIVRPETEEDVESEDTPDSSGEDKAESWNLPGQPALTEDLVAEIRERARRELPSKGQGQMKWCRRVAPEYGVCSSVIRSAVAASGAYSEFGLDLTEQAEAVA